MGGDIPVEQSQARPDSLGLWGPRIQRLQRPPMTGLGRSQVVNQLEEEGIEEAGDVSLLDVNSTSNLGVDSTGLRL